MKGHVVIALTGLDIVGGMAVVVVTVVVGVKVTYALDSTRYFSINLTLHAFGIGGIGVRRVGYLILQFQVGLHFSSQRLVRVESGSPGPA